MGEGEAKKRETARHLIASLFCLPLSVSICMEYKVHAIIRPSSLILILTSHTAWKGSVCLRYGCTWSRWKIDCLASESESEPEPARPSVRPTPGEQAYESRILSFLLCVYALMARLCQSQTCLCVVNGSLRTFFMPLPGSLRRSGGSIRRCNSNQMWRNPNISK